VVTLTLGSDAVCSDGYRGEVLAVVIDPAARIVTHVVVEPPSADIDPLAM
jgi:hypothetical protein